MRSDDGKQRGWVSRLYRALVSLYPWQVRRRHGEDMQEMFEDIYRHEPESRGAGGRARLAVDTTRDILGGAVVERLPAWDMLRQDLRHGLRRLRLHPTLSIAAVLTLALGIGAVTTVFSFVHALVLDPLPYPDLDRIVAVGETTLQEGRRGLDGEGWLDGPQIEQLAAAPAVESVAALGLFLTTMTGDGDPEEVVGWRATPTLFRVLGVRPHIGRVYTDGEDDSAAVVLGYAFWQRRFGGSESIVGRRLRVGDREREVVGVLPPGAEFPLGADLWVPLAMSTATGPERWQRVVARLAPDASLAQLRAQLAPIAAEAGLSAPGTTGEQRIEAEPLLVNITTYTRDAFGFLMGAAGFLLLLVCGNVANIQLAQAAARRREMAVRQAMGAPRGRLIRQLLTEGVALAALAAIAGTLLAVWGAQGMRAALAHERWRFYFAGVDDIGINLPVLAFTAAVALASVILFGLLPALRSSGVEVEEALKTTTGGGRRGSGRLRRGLVVLEVALSVVLLFGAGLMAVSIGALAAVDPRVDTGVYTARLRLPVEYDEPSRSRAFFDELVDRVGAVPGVGSLALTDRDVLGAGRGTPIEIAPGASAPAARVQHHVVGGDYFGTLGIPVLRGRALATAPQDVVVSRSLAERLWPGEDAVGRRLRLGPEAPWLDVVGVVGDVPGAWNDSQPALSTYVPHTRSPTPRMQLLVRIEGDEATTVNAIREAIRRIDESVVVFAPETIAATLESQAGPSRAGSNLVGIMAIAALLVCLSGVYALVAHDAGRRTREIGVRMALGAGRRRVVRMLVRDGLTATAVGVGIGLVPALAVGALLRGFLRGFQGNAAPQGPILLGLAAGMLALAAVSSWLPARRAARTDPADTLRAE